MIEKSHDYYLFPFYPLLFTLVGYGSIQLLKINFAFTKPLVYALVLAAPLICLVRMHGRWDPDSPGFNPDLLTHKVELREAVPDESLCVVAGDPTPRVFLYYLHKKGWVLGWDGTGPENFSELVEQGARYLYSDSRETEQHPEVAPCLDEQVAEFGSIRVFRLRPGDYGEGPF
jgi:hypothetical protein